MRHPFEILQPEYTKLLAAMIVLPDKKKAIDEVCLKLVGYRDRYIQVTKAIGVPSAFIAASFQREASSDFTKNPAQGWPLSSNSRIIPRNGPFRNWYDAAIAAYRLNGLDKVGADRWTWELICFYGEMFNGFGYRDEHHMHSPYLWGGTNIQTVGKYVEDGKFDPTVMDPQIGIIPMAKRLIEMSPDFGLPVVIPPPAPSGLSSPETGGGTKFVQQALNELGFEPMLDVDGSYGRRTMLAVESFQRSYGLEVDGMAGEKTVAALCEAIEAQGKDGKA